MSKLKLIMNIMLLIGLVGSFFGFWVFFFLGLVNHDVFHLTLANTNMIIFGMLFYIEDHIS